MGADDDRLCPNRTPRILGNEICRKLWPVLSWNQRDVQRVQNVTKLAVSKLYRVYTDSPSRHLLAPCLFLYQEMAFPRE